MPEREALGTPKAGTELRPVAGRIGWLRTVLLPVCVLAVLSSSSYAYENRPLAAEGAAYEEEIKARVRDDREKLSPEDLEMLKTLVGPILPLPSPLPSVGKGPRRKGAPDAVFAYELLIAKGKGTSATWLKLARAHSDPGPHRDLQKAARAAYMAYKAAGSSLSRAMALGFLATVFDKTRDSSQALMAIREANRLVSREKAAREGAVIGRLARSLDQTRKRIEKRHSFRLRRFRVFSNRPKPSVCLTFSGPLAGRGRVRYRDYIQIDPAARVALNPEGKSLCLEGLAHGHSYKITVLKGMPDRHGLKTPASATVRAAVPDRAPQVAFRNSAYVLPARKAKDLPLSVVNVRTVSLRVYHIVERNLIREIMAGNITRQLYNWKLREFREDTGELLWQGSLDVETRVNRETRTSIPLGEILKDGRPGIYVVSAKAGGVLATQWVVMSDLGLSTVKGRDGLHVFVRSLKSAKPVAGAEVRLIARNNKVLDAVTSDVRGVARFSPGRVRGRGGNAPAAWHLTKILEGVPRPPNRVQNSGATPRAPIALKTGTSYGYRDAWAIGYNKRYTAGVWVGRPDGTPVPGATGRRAAAPLLFKVFEQLPPPSPSLDERAPEGALIADNRGLPPHLRRLRVQALSERGMARDRTPPPRLEFPRDGSTVELSGADAELSRLPLIAHGGESPFNWLINGRPISGGRKENEWNPDGPGFVRVTVVDAAGRSASAEIQIR